MRCAAHAQPCTSPALGRNAAMIRSDGNRALGSGALDTSLSSSFGRYALLRCTTTIWRRGDMPTLRDPPFPPQSPVLLFTWDLAAYQSQCGTVKREHVCDERISRALI